MEGQAHNSPTINYDNDNIAPPAYSIDNLPPPNPIPNDYIQYPQFIPRRQVINEYSQQNSHSIPPSNIDNTPNHNNPAIPIPIAISPKDKVSNNYNQPLIQHHSPPSSGNKSPQQYNSVIITQHNMANNNINPIHSPPTQIVIVPQGPKFHGPSNQYSSTTAIAYPQLLPNNTQTQPLNDNVYPGLQSNTRQKKSSSHSSQGSAQRPYHQDLFCLAFITFFFFPILGLLAMCKAAEANTAYQRGDYQLARIYNRQCRRYMKWAIIFCIVILLFGIVMSVIS